MIEMIQAHIDQLTEDAKEIDKCIIRNILGEDDYSHRKLNNSLEAILQSLECMKTLIKNLKSKNLEEWTTTQRQ